MNNNFINALKDKSYIAIFDAVVNGYAILPLMNMDTLEDFVNATSAAKVRFQSEYGNSDEWLVFGRLIDEISEYYIRAMDSGLDVMRQSLEEHRKNLCENYLGFGKEEADEEPEQFEEEVSDEVPPDEDVNSVDFAGVWEYTKNAIATIWRELDEQRRVDAVKFLYVLHGITFKGNGKMCPISREEIEQVIKSGVFLGCPNLHLNFDFRWGEIIENHHILERFSVFTDDGAEIRMYNSNKGFPSDALKEVGEELAKEVAEKKAPAV